MSIPNSTGLVLDRRKLIFKMKKDPIVKHRAGINGVFLKEVGIAVRAIVNEMKKRGYGVERRLQYRFLKPPATALHYNRGSKYVYTSKQRRNLKFRSRSGL